MIKRVLIPLDGSELAEEVVPHLLRFVAPERTELLLMAALSPVIPSLGELSQPSLAQVLAFAGEQVSQRVQAVAKQLNQLGFRVAHQFVLGSPAECILRIAEEAHVDLIAMSTHGRTGFGRAILGSVADQVVRNARPPVFLVSANAVSINSEPAKEQLPKTILVPLDGSELAETAVPIAQQLAQAIVASIHLLRVIEPANLRERELMFSNSESLASIQQTLSGLTSSYLEQILRRLHLAGIASSYQIAYGDPAAAIIQFAASEKVDLLVMSTHGRTGVERMVYGSVTSQVIHAATCPLLLLRGQESAPVQQPVGNVVPATSFL